MELRTIINTLAHLIQMGVQFIVMRNLMNLSVNVRKVAATLAVIGDV